MLNVSHRLQEGIIIINKLLPFLKYCTNSPLFVVLASISPLFVILMSIINIVLISVCTRIPHVLLFNLPLIQLNNIDFITFYHI